MTPRKWTAIAVVTMVLAACSETGEIGPDVNSVARVTIDEVLTALLPGDTVQLTARALSANNTALLDRTITFSADNSTVASVSTTGLVIALQPGTATVTASAGGRSGTRGITVNHPIPTLLSITPDSVPNVAAVDITVRGTGFYSATHVRLNGVAKPTALVSDVEVRVSLSVVDLTMAGEGAITVFNPTPGGGTSESLSLSVPQPPPNLCGSFEPLTLGTSVTGVLYTNDCNSGTASAPSYQDSYRFTTTEITAVRFALSSSAFDPVLFVTSATDSGVLHAIETTNSLTPAHMRLFLPAETFTLRAGTVRSGAVGAYALSSSTSTAATVTNCEPWYVVLPMTISQTATGGDCDNHSLFYDEYRIVLRAGQTVTITLESSAFNAALWMYDSQGANGVWDDNSGGGTSARIVFTATVPGVYTIAAGPNNYGGSSGPYLLRIN